MNIVINITNVNIKKLVNGSRFVTEFIPKLEELGAEYNIVYKNDSSRPKDEYTYNVDGDDSILMEFCNKPNNIKEFIDVLDELSKYFSNDLLDNGAIESLNLK